MDQFLPVPDAINILLPNSLQLMPLERRQNYRWRYNGQRVFPYLHDKAGICAVCHTERPLMVLGDYPGQGRVHVWFDVKRLQAALDIAKAMGLEQIGIAQLQVNDKPSPLLGLIGRHTKTAIVLAPLLRFEWEDREEYCKDCSAWGHCDEYPPECSEYQPEEAAEGAVLMACDGESPCRECKGSGSECSMDPAECGHAVLPADERRAGAV